ncbi:amidohydrolase family protein [Maricaulis sp.]|uniref:amidohydrolase family protein n=1 Tax=Maricaulis sp. TaxID=1486257 RepID=UPI0026261893|nr:amidohydrolase family protein [Maricaulis sp.]
MFTRFMPAILLALAVPAAFASQPPQMLSESVTRHIRVDARQLALTGIQVIDGSGGPAQTDQTVLIENGRILAVGADGALAIPEGFERLDMDGHTVIPGFVGLHNHLHHPGVPVSHHAAPHLYLAGGVTTLFSAGSAAPLAELNMAGAVSRGLGPGPDMRIAAPYVTGPGGNWVMPRPETPGDARAFVDYWASAGVAGFKLYRHVTPAIAAAVIEHAHTHGLAVTGHLCSLTFQEAAEMGIDRIEHGFLSMSDLVADKARGECPSTLSSLETAEMDGPEIAAIVESLVARDVTLTSTLAIIESHFAHRPQGDPRAIEMLSADARAAYDARQTALRARRDTTRFTPELFNRVLSFERGFVAAGGRLVAGPDNGRHVVPGYGDQRNLELLVEAGFPVAEAVRIMTHNGAVELGLGSDRGLVRAGYRADLVVVAGDLAADPAVIRSTVYVFRDGHGYDPESLADAARGDVGLR